MSLRLRFAKTYKVEMSQNSFGNYDSFAVLDLFTDMDNMNDIKGVFYCNEATEDFEIDKNRLVGVIKGIKNMSDEEYQEYEISEPKENLITFFEDALENAEPSIDYVKFEWA